VRACSPSGLPSTSNSACSGQTAFDVPPAACSRRWYRAREFRRVRGCGFQHSVTPQFATVPRALRLFADTQGHFWGDSVYSLLVRLSSTPTVLCQAVQYPLMHSSLSRWQSAPQTASRSVQPFCRTHRSAQHTDIHRDYETYSISRNRPYLCGVSDGTENLGLFYLWWPTRADLRPKTRHTTPTTITTLRPHHTTTKPHYISNCVFSRRLKFRLKSSVVWKMF